MLLDDEAAPLRAVDAATPPAALSIHARFAAIAERTPDNLAVSWAGGTLSYGELDAAADRLAAGAGCSPTRAACRNPGRNKAFARPAVHRRDARGAQGRGHVRTAGAGNAPGTGGFDSAPKRRAIVVDERLLDQWPARDHDGDFRPVDVQPEQAAYVVFTSGTTGEPKGVIGTHAAVGAYADDHLDHVLRPAAARLGRPLRIAHAWSFAFDAAWQPLVALLDGHAVHVVDEHTQTDAEALVQVIAEHRIDMIDTTPSMFAQLKAFGLLNEVPLAVLALGGEAVGSAAWAFIRNRVRRAHR